MQKNAINILYKKYKIIDNEIFYLKNIKNNKFLSSYVFDSNRQQYKYILEKFKINNNNLYVLSDINNSDIIVTLWYIHGICKQIIDNNLIAIKNINIDENNIPEIYEDKLSYCDYVEDTWRK